MAARLGTKSAQKSQPSMSVEEQGLTFNKRWVVRGTIGKGAFSEIYAAADTLGNTNELVAIKYQGEGFDSSIMKWESMVLLDLADIPTVPRMIYYGQEHGRDFMVMELLMGEDMANLRDRVRTSIETGLFPVEVASHLTRQMIVALQAMHAKGYVHRDVKPSNFVRRSPNSTEFCVIDFGLAKKQFDTQGQLRTERESVEFRGTTIYASSFVHSGHDQCPRDDLLSTIHVFLDLVLGDLPWRQHARNKDKVTVGAMKAALMSDPGAFLDSIVRAQESNTQSEAKELREAVERIRAPISACIAHLKELKYTDTPDYGLLQQRLRQPVDAALTDEVVGALSYTTASGFTWVDGTTLEDRMARFARSSSSSGGGAAQRPRKSTEGAKSSSGNALSSSAAKPWAMQPVQGTKEEHRLSILRDKARALLAEAKSARTAAGTTTATAGSSSSRSTSPPPPPSSYSPRASSGGKPSNPPPPQAPQLGLDTAVRWKFLAREAMKVPESTLASAVTVDAVEACLDALVQCDHFFTCNLGELDANWAAFADVQAVVGAFYDFVLTVRRKQQQTAAAASEATMEPTTPAVVDSTAPGASSEPTESAEGAAAAERDAAAEVEAVRRTQEPEREEAATPGLGAKEDKEGQARIAGEGQSGLDELAAVGEATEGVVMAEADAAEEMAQVEALLRAQEQAEEHAKEQTTQGQEVEGDDEAGDGDRAAKRSRTE